ncbi:hypothetical protein ACFQ51_49050 [Streptomyces kaempferi]
MLTGGMPVVPLMYFGVVDVRDVVDLHLRAMLHPKAAGERFLAVGGPSISFLGMARTLRAHLPAAADALPSSELTLEQMREAAKTERAAGRGGTGRPDSRHQQCQGAFRARLGTPRRHPHGP